MVKKSSGDDFVQFDAETGEVDGRPPFSPAGAADYDFYKSSGVRSDLDYFEPSLTRQEFADECDINTLMARYEKSGAISHVNRHEPRYIDVSMFGDLRERLDLLQIATVEFNALDPKIRFEFDNDPVKFVEFATNKDNLPRMREWGLAPPEEKPVPPMKVEVVNPAPPDEDKPA